MLHFTFLPPTTTIPAHKIAEGDTLLLVSETCITFASILELRYYDEQYFARLDCLDLFEATNLDGVGPFHSTFTWTLEADQEVKVIC